MVNLDDLIMLVQTCEQCVALFKIVVPMARRTWPAHNKIEYGMLPFMDEGISPRFGGLNLEIIFICNK